VAVDTYDLRGVQDKEGRLHEEILNEANWPALVFVSSPDKANELAADLVTRGVSVGDGTGIAEWMDTNYGGRWALGDAARSGAGVHHGRIPRSLASRFVTLFNRGTLPILICTSTLIEGVNTAAKSVLIYDKRIANRNYDFFTFSNIRGRAGRLGQHHVGRVYLFNTPPEQETYAVSAPLFDEIDDVPDEFVVHVEARDSTPVISERIEVIGARVGLDGAQLRQFSSLGIEVLEKMRAATEDALSHGADVRWSGYPDYERIQALMTIICSVRSAREFGCRTERQLAMYVHQLRNARSMRAFFRWHFDSYRGEPGQLDNVFKFLRAAEYGLPEYCALIEAFVKQKVPGVSYALLVAELPRWFRAEELKILEEQGVPIQISERFWVEGDTVRTLGQRLRDLAIAREPALTPFEHEWITSALPA
jgi:hypothetical protein